MKAKCHYNFHMNDQKSVTKSVNFCYLHHDSSTFLAHLFLFNKILFTYKTKNPSTINNRIHLIRAVNTDAKHQPVSVYDILTNHFLP